VIVFEKQAALEERLWSATDEDRATNLKLVVGVLKAELSRSTRDHGTLANEIDEIPARFAAVEGETVARMKNTLEVSRYE
jgi:hypothetical protein